MGGGGGMISNIRRIRFRGRCFWQCHTCDGWSIEPAKFVRYLLRQRGLSADAIDDLIADASPVDACPKALLTRLTYDGRTIGYRAGTWIGPRYASESQVKTFLRANRFSAEEIVSL